MTIFTDSFNLMRETLPEALCIVRVGTEDYQGISSGAYLVREHDDFASIDEVSATVRILQSEEKPRSGAHIGKVISVKFYGEDSFKRFRISARKPSGGIIRIGLTDEGE